MKINLNQRFGYVGVAAKHLFQTMRRNFCRINWFYCGNFSLCEWRTRTNGKINDIADIGYPRSKFTDSVAFFFL